MHGFRFLTISVAPRPVQFLVLNDFFLDIKKCISSPEVFLKYLILFFPWAFLVCLIRSLRLNLFHFKVSTGKPVHATFGLTSIFHKIRKVIFIWMGGLCVKLNIVLSFSNLKNSYVSVISCGHSNYDD